MASPDQISPVIYAVEEAMALAYLRRTDPREATVLARVIAERDQLRVLAGPVPAGDEQLHKIMQGLKTVLARRVSSDADAVRWYYEDDVAYLLSRMRLAEAEAKQAKGELRGVFLALSHLSLEHITPEWRARMKAIYHEKGGELDV